MHRTPRGSIKSANGSMANSGWKTTHSNIDARHVGLDNTDLLMEAAKGKKQLRFVRLLFGFCSVFVRFDVWSVFFRRFVATSRNEVSERHFP
jgi:hypothetical protein